MKHRILPLAEIPPPLVEALLDRAFGTDRHARTAYRVREGTRAIAALSFAVVAQEGALLGSIQCWPVELTTGRGAVPMLMVGPVAIDPECQQAGLGRALTRHMLDAAAESGIEGADALMLIGDLDYYGRFFGFSAERTGGWDLPGPFERERLLARGDAVPATRGTVGPRFVPSDLPIAERFA